MIPTDVAGSREVRGGSRVLMGERREEDGFSVCWDGDKGRPGGRIILCWRCWRQAKDGGGGGGKLDGRRRGWGGSNK